MSERAPSAYVACEERLRRGGLVLLDGGTGSEIVRRGVPQSVGLWAVGPLLNAPEVLRDIHETYIAAGAQIITTATFRTTPRALATADLAGRAEELTRRAVAIAVEARERARSSQPVVIAGSMAPLEDCYKPDAVPPESELTAEHEVQARVLAEAGVDLILAETMNTVHESRAALMAGLVTGLPVWISLCCRSGGELLSGEPLKEALDALLPLSPSALLVNCSSPAATTEALEALQGPHTVALGAYANNGRPQESNGWAFTGDYPPQRYVETARGWLERGARVIGGCCGTTPEHIRALHEGLPASPGPPHSLR